jgi:hypothetical protein
MINEEILKNFNGNKIIYSPYGYILINKEDYDNPEKKIINFTGITKEKSNENLLIGSINKTNLKEKINIKLKTLYGNRTIYTFEINPEDKINIILKKLISKEEESEEKSKKFNKSKSFRIISSKGLIKELNLSKKFYEEKIIDNQLLILSPNHPIHFNEFSHGNQITIENNIYANKSYGDDAQIALIDKGFNYGISYIEFILETEPDERSIVIGISIKRKDYFLNEMNNFWGFVLSDAKKISNDIQKDYGKICQINDIIGVLLCFNDNNNLNVSFFVNGENQGIAFENLPSDLYFPCVVLSYEGARVKVNEYSNIPEEFNNY